MAYSTELQYGEQDAPHIFCPGMTSYLRFAQGTGPYLTSQRDIVRSIWDRCFYGKDYDGAAMVRNIIMNT